MSQSKLEAIEKFATQPNIKTFRHPSGGIVFIKSMTYSTMLEDVVCVDAVGNMILLSELLNKGFENLDESVFNDNDVVNSPEP